MQELYELEKRYQSRLISDIEKFQGHGYWIHFGQTPKLGVRNRPFHNDPPGVYFYNLDWLLTNNSFITSGILYATDYQYWTIVQLNDNGNGVVLGELSDDTLDTIDPDHKLRNTQGRDSSGALFWNMFRTNKKIRMLLKLSYIIDDGNGIIHSREKYQMVVFDPRAIRIIASGTQYAGMDNYKKLQKNSPMEDTSYQYVSILKELRNLYGGEITWNKKVPSWKCNVSGAEFNIILRKKALSFPDIVLHAKWGKAVTDTYIKSNDIIILNMNEVLEKLTSKIDQIIEFAKRKKDLFFIPYITEKEGKAFINAMIDKPFTMVTTIENHYKKIEITGTRTVTDGVNTMVCNIISIIGEEHTNLKYIIRINGTVIGNANFLYETKEKSPDILPSKYDLITDNFESNMENYYPEDGKISYHFIHLDDYREFIGWVASECGIKPFDKYQKEIDQYKNSTHHSLLTSEIKRVFR